MSWVLIFLYGLDVKDISWCIKSKQHFRKNIAKELMEFPKDTKVPHAGPLQ